MTSNAKIAPRMLTIFFFFNDTATTEIYTLSLHDALPICRAVRALARAAAGTAAQGWTWRKPPARQRSARTAVRRMLLGVLGIGCALEAALGSPGIEIGHGVHDAAAEFAELGAAAQHALLFQRAR